MFTGIAEEPSVGLKVSVPVLPFLRAEVPIRASVFRPLAKLLHRAPEQVLCVVGARSFVHVHADDEGTVTVYMKVVNMTDRPVRVDDLQLDLFYIGGVTTGVSQPLFRPTQDLIAPTEVGEVCMTINLGSGAIRQLLQRVIKAQNLFSTARVSITVGGRLHLHIPGSLAALQRTRLVRLPFNVEIQTSELNINCPGARSQ